jgi:hypothetical protein
LEERGVFFFFCFFSFFFFFLFTFFFFFFFLICPIYTTTFGIGLDFNATLTDQISKNRGANYFSVNSASEFKRKLDADFEYFVTPLVFDLSLKVVKERNAEERRVVRIEERSK